ncbi:RNA polymerase sigma factor SigJ [Denitromonas sp.]|uniref:RNA polymerase sigma factor SigJ n=1 Tax=Denitromonas sp. TaxID=2734609 RepID=UPI003A8C0FEE
MSLEAFARERGYLVRLAYRMLGSVADAEDAVQDTYLRWQAAGEPALDTPRAWFTRTCTRLCLDRLKSAHRTREQYVGEWLPEPFVDDSETRAVLDESLSMALLATIERLTPAERAAFLLHDVFDYGFDDIASMLELSPANCRQLATRARRHLAGDRVRAPHDAGTVQRLGQAFFAAIRGGDLAGLQAVLSEDVVLRADGGGKVSAARRPVEGRTAVLDFLQAIFMRGEAFRPEVREHWFNGAPGMLVFDAGQLVSAFHFEVHDGRIAGIFVQRNPDKLGGFVAVTPH